MCVLPEMEYHWSRRLKLRTLALTQVWCFRICRLWYARAYMVGPAMKHTVLRSLLFLHCTLSSFTFSLHPCWFLTIFSDFYPHRLVLSHRLHSSFYTSLPSYSLTFYDDTSLCLGQALLGLCTLSSFYINCRISCILLNFDLLDHLSNIPRS